MVDFDNDVTIGTPAIDIVRVLVLQRRNDLLEAIELYKKQDSQGINSDLATLKARTLSLFLELQAYLERKLKAEQYNKLKEIVLNSNSFEDILTFVHDINYLLDELRLIRLDTKQVYNPTKYGEEDKVKGY
jgi:hypothetical protein